MVWEPTFYDTWAASAVALRMPKDPELESDPVLDLSSSFRALRTNGSHTPLIFRDWKEHMSATTPTQLTPVETAFNSVQARLEAADKTTQALSAQLSQSRQEHAHDLKDVNDTLSEMRDVLAGFAQASGFKPAGPTDQAGIHAALADDVTAHASIAKYGDKWLLATFVNKMWPESAKNSGSLTLRVAQLAVDAQNIDKVIILTKLL